MLKNKPRIILKATHCHQKDNNSSSIIKPNKLTKSVQSDTSSSQIDDNSTTISSIHNIEDEKFRSDYENFKKKVILKKNSRDLTDKSENNEPSLVPLQEKILPREFFTVDPVILARKLLGKIIVRKVENQIIKCKIVETEAYCGGQDKGSHAFNNKMTERTKYIYQEGGHLYVYLIYGLSCCMNITARFKGEPGAVLIRAVEVLEGLDHVVGNRNMKNLSKLGKELVNGPGKLCAAMKIDRSHNAHDVTNESGIYVIEGDHNKPFEIVVSKRINIDYAEEYKDKPWRFYIKDNIYVSCKGEILEIITSKEAMETPPEIEEQTSQKIVVESLEKFRAPSTISKRSFLK